MEHGNNMWSGMEGAVRVSFYLPARQVFYCRFVELTETQQYCNRTQHDASAEDIENEPQEQQVPSYLLCHLIVSAHSETSVQFYPIQ